MRQRLPLEAMRREILMYEYEGVVPGQTRPPKAGLSRIWPAWQQRLLKTRERGSSPGFPRLAGGIEIVPPPPQPTRPLLS
jgi:hypothetical protein